jgi:hypothetical protein
VKAVAKNLKLYEIRGVCKKRSHCQSAYIQYSTIAYAEFSIHMMILYVSISESSRVIPFILFSNKSLAYPLLSRHVLFPSFSLILNRWPSQINVDKSQVNDVLNYGVNGVSQGSTMVNNNLRVKLGGGTTFGDASCTYGSPDSCTYMHTYGRYCRYLLTVVCRWAVDVTVDGGGVRCPQ